MSKPTGLPTPPIDISTTSRFSSSSPRNQASNLTAGLQKAARATSPDGQGNFVPRHNDTLKPSFGRQDSMNYFGSSFGGTRPPISASKNRRESMAGSFMGGMSWGGISVGSFVQDEYVAVSRKLL